MNADMFDNYLLMLCLKLGPGAMLILDKAPYYTWTLHSAPMKNSCYDDMTICCDENGIWYDETRATTDRSVKDRILKDYFFQAYVAPSIRPWHNVKTAKAIASDFGVEILRLPSYHCFFNLIEFVWSINKNNVAKHNSITQIAHKLEAVKALLVTALEGIEEQTFINWVYHTFKLEEKYRQAQAIDINHQLPPTGGHDDEDDDDDIDLLREKDDDDGSNVVD
uniref:Uncharacterized protein n=1 Tax=Plectus sambesii TaxID=2011161 RepID=A0A914X4Q2_9BILA